MERTAAEAGNVRIGVMTEYHAHSGATFVTDPNAGRPIAIDLFAGAGGLSLGLEQAGFHVAAAIEIDPIHAAVHELNFPTTRVICSDIRELSGDSIRAAASLGSREIDAVVGGPPCQGFSLIGHRVLEDPRNALVMQFLRIVIELRPRLFLMENVPGMAVGKQTQLLTELLERFERAGYRVRLPYRTLVATSYGVPQTRERLFLIGARPNVPLPDYPESTTILARPADSKRPTMPKLLLDDLPACPTVADAISDLPDVECFEPLFDSDELRICLSGGSLYARQMRGEAVDPGDRSHPRLAQRCLLTGCLRARHTELSRRRFAATRPGSTEPISRFYRLALDGVCNTLRAGTASERGAFTAPRPIHPVHPRCITVREAARLHSYPDWFRFHRTIWHGFRQIGNSVPPLLARAVAIPLIQALGTEPERPTVAIQQGPPELASFDTADAAHHFGVSPTIIAPRSRRNSLREA